LRIGADDFSNIGNVASLLDSANEEQGLRYFKPKGSGYPTLSWTRDAVEQLLRAIETSVKK
jgi:hypothetical protein